ncbi:hypothetical protein [Streptomyces sp. A30]|uniref:hypothetical protein n=1 Tax=Streptomyces sp. A30 TaxID=2789273 RepID=UPI003980D512
MEWATFVPSALLLAATPGANQLLALRSGLRHGLAPAVSASLGRFAAFALMVIAVAAGSERYSRSPRWRSTSSSGAAWPTWGGWERERCWRPYAGRRRGPQPAASLPTRA